MKTEVIKKDQEIEFPCLMKHRNNDMYVLFDKPNAGTILINPEVNINTIGTMLFNIDINDFELTDDTIQVSN